MFLKSSKGGVWGHGCRRQQGGRGTGACLSLSLSLSPLQVKTAVAKTDLRERERERERDGSHPFSIQLPRMLEDTLFLISCGFVPSFSAERNHPQGQNTAISSPLPQIHSRRREREREKNK
ncbi:hypothetical protein AAC387_Pa12g2283 [Persea americana]